MAQANSIDYNLSRNGTAVQQRLRHLTSRHLGVLSGWGSSVRGASLSEDARRYFPVSWEEMHRDARALSWRLAAHAPWTGIVAIARGGLVPAQIVARELEVRLIDTICVASYDHETQRRPQVLKSVTGDGEGWLIVDDLVDTGQTGRIVREMLPKAHFATVYAKPAGRSVVDSFVTEVSQDTWILFPWDMQPQFAQPIIGTRNLG